MDQRLLKLQEELTEMHRKKGEVSVCECLPVQIQIAQYGAIFSSFPLTKVEGG